MGMIRNIFLILLIVFNYEFAKSNTINIQDLSNTDLKKIIKNANPYDTILINSGKFKGESIFIDKPLSIIGKNNPIIEGLQNDHIFIFRSDNITLKNLIIENSGYSYVQDRAAIRMDSSNNCTFENNKFDNCMFAIYAAAVKNFKVINNIFKGNSLGEAASGNAVHLWYCKDVFVNHNTISGHRDGIYLEFTESVKIYNNSSFENVRYGLHFMFSHNAEYKNNTFNNNGSGVAVMYTRNVLMENNLFENNRGSASYGLLLKDIENSTVINNKILSNSTGIYVDGGGRNHIKNNLIKNNAWAIRIYASSSGNTIENNNIIGNSFDVTTNSNMSTNKFIGNYWDKYRGYDYNKDGVGDVPYYPVRLFAYLVEKNPPFIVLMHSFFIFVLDMAESIIPSIVPDSIIDNSPSMVPIK